MNPTLGAWLHDWSPFLIEAGPGWGLRWYGLAYSVGFIAAWVILRWLSRRGYTPIPAHRMADVVLIFVACVIVGGRVGYVLVYDRSMLTHVESAFPWWGVLMINKGGMAYHGALVGVLIAGVIIARGFREAGDLGASRVGRVPWRHVMDAGALACTVGLGLGRVANFVNGELLGKVVGRAGEPAPWWSVRFPQELLLDRPPALTQSQQRALDELVAVHARATDRSHYDTIARVIDTLQRGPGEASARIARELEPLLTARHPSQLYQAFFEGVVLTAICWWVARKPRKAGVAGCWFLIGYGVLRVVAEFYRLPDEQFAVGRPLGLSRGQWLSAGMVVAGAGVLAWIARVPESQRFGGWRRAGDGAKTRDGAGTQPATRN
jgi:phosphatidylglycerol:prolipoprotein diacylglycerol transferase